MLTRDEKKAYHDIYEALSCTASSFQTARIDPKSFAKAYISTQLANSIVFAVLIIVLLVRPTGLLGKRIQEKV